jgi:hypothetical protein
VDVLDEDEGADDDENLPFVCQKFLLTGVATTV